MGGDRNVQSLLVVLLGAYPEDSLSSLDWDPRVAPWECGHRLCHGRTADWPSAHPQQLVEANKEVSGENRDPPGLEVISKF